jgi:hypothetical protein
VVSATKETPPARAPERRPPAEETPSAASGGWRRWVPWVLIILAAVIGLVAALNVWVKRQALSTDNWTQASSQLLENSEIRNALSVYIVDQLYENVDVGKSLDQRLPPALKGLGAPLAAGLEPALVRRTNTFLGRPRVQQLWENANRRAHELLIALLDGKHGVLVATNGNVVLNLRPLVENIAESTGVGSRLAEKVPPDAGQITVMKGSQLDVARKTVKTIRALSYFLVFLVIALFAAGVYISRDRRRTLLAVGFSFLIVGLLVLVARRLGGNYLVDALTDNPDAKRPVSATWAIGTELLRNVGINIVVYGLLTIFAAWVAGPARWAVSLRRRLAPSMRERPVLVYGAVSLVLLILLLTGPTDGQRVYPLLLLFALALLGTEVLRRQTAREFPPSTVRQA